jgi:hypothetical protein
MNDTDPTRVDPGYRHDGEERDLHIRTYLEIQTTNGHLRDLKLIGVLLIATIAFPPIAWLLLILAAIVTIAGFLGKSTAAIINKCKGTSNKMNAR